MPLFIINIQPLG